MGKVKTTRGATKPRIHSPLLKGKTRGDEVIEFAKKLNQPLMPWQELIVKDFFAIDGKSKFIRRTGLLLVARQSGKSHLGRIMCLAHLFLFKSPRVLIASSNRAMALVSFREMCYLIESNEWLNCQIKAIRYANGVVYGLASSVWTSNHSRAMRLAKAFDFGCVWINTHIPLVAEMPHGGYKRSGYGKDLSSYGFEDYTRIKHVMTNLNG